MEPNMRKEPVESRPEDSPTAWFAVLERARLTDDYERADVAMRELKRLGVLVRFPQRRKGVDRGR